MRLLLESSKSNTGEVLFGCDSGLILGLRFSIGECRGRNASAPGDCSSGWKLADLLASLSTTDVHIVVDLRRLRLVELGFSRFSTKPSTAATGMVLFIGLTISKREKRTKFAVNMRRSQKALVLAGD